jgi:hypothetical protein
MARFRFPVGSVVRTDIPDASANDRDTNEGTSSQQQPPGAIAEKGQDVATQHDSSMSHRWVRFVSVEDSLLTRTVVAVTTALLLAYGPDALSQMLESINILF